MEFVLTADDSAVIDLLADADESRAEVVQRVLRSGLHATFGQLSPSDFERLVARSLERRGYEVEHSGGRGDEGVDLVARKGSETVVVQCKRYGTQPISPAQVRELLGAVTARRATKGIFVTTSSFTEAAREFGSTHSLELVGAAGIRTWLASSSGRFCLKCGQLARSASPSMTMWVCASCGELNQLPERA